MFVRKNMTFRGIMRFSGGHIIWLTAWATSVVILHHFTHDYWMDLPGLPLSIIGTAVAFYVGFKNNQSYDRLWEARKIWGAIVNSSRAWGSAVKGFIGMNFTMEGHSEDELFQVKKRLIYRHVGWLYALRSQLLIPTSWEHVSQPGHIGRINRKRMKTLGVGLLDDDTTATELRCFLPKEEYDVLINHKNTATQIIDKQSQELRELREKGLINDFQHTELQQILYDFYVHQGKAERIKKFPLPRQYGGMSNVFVGIFIFLLPFTMVSVFHALGEAGVWVSIPFTVLVAWIYLMMELVGDYSENPFEGLSNDIPMLSLCRVIEIDLREMLGETDLPPSVEAKNGVLM